MRLLDYPSVIVRVRCLHCAREGRYRLAKLAERYGASILLDSLLDHLTESCVHRNNDRLGRRSREKACAAHFAELGEKPTATTRR